jgi:hypothetical protein
MSGSQSRELEKAPGRIHRLRPKSEVGGKVLTEDPDSFTPSAEVVPGRNSSGRASVTTSEGCAAGAQVTNGPRGVGAQRALINILTPRPGREAEIED